MSFLQPFILLGLPLILVPVIIHLINRMRHKPQPWAAMRFVISATRASTSHAKLRQFLILLFRVLAVAMLVIFLARPLAGGWMGWMLSSAPDVVIVLLDRSASMETKISADTTKRQQALKLVAEAAKQFEGATHLILLDSALRTPQEIVNASALTDVSLTSSTDTAADIPGMLHAAFAYLIENRAGSAEIWIASDLQRSNWQPEDPRFKNAIKQLTSLPQKVRVRLLALSQPPERNTSILIQDVIRRTQSTESELQFAVDFQRSSDVAESLPVRTILDGAESQAEATLEGQSMRWRHKLGLGNRKESGWGKFEVPSDANAQDNAAYFVYGSETILRTLVVTGDAQAGRFLRLAGSVIADNKEAAQLISPGEFGGANLDASSLIIWQAPLPGGTEAERIQGFVEQGGVVLFLPPGNAESTQFEGLGWSETQSAEADKSFSIVRWDEQQGPLAKTDEGSSLPLPQTEFKRRQVITGQKNVLAAFDDGVPFLARQTFGKGQIYFCASLPSAEWSSLGDGPVLVPMMQRLLQAGSRRLQQVTFVNCGELSPADQQRQWTTLDTTSAKNVKLNAGVYRSGERLIALNRPPTEDDPEMLDATEARNLFAGMSFQMLQEKQRQSDALQGEVWRFFLFGMLIFLIGEGILILPGKSTVKPQDIPVGATTAKA